jgi:hypothetical protein
MTQNVNDTLLNEALRIARLIERARLPLSSEKAVQADLGAVLSQANIAHEREYRLNDRDIPDFFLPGGVVLEVKMKGARKMDVYRQLERYAAHSDVHALVLVTNLAMGMPAAINGKPVLMTSLGRGWL